MNKVKIITDSTCDLPKDLTKRLDIEVIPLEVTIGGTTYMDGEEITGNEFLYMMDEVEEMPVTSQINPSRFSNIYKKYIDEGYDIVSLHISSKLSGTFQSAGIAKDMLEADNIFILDSLNVTCGLGLLVIKACNLRDKGLEAKDILEELKEVIPKVKSTLNFQSLDNLVKGGRLSKTQAVLGSLLGIKLNLAVENGEMIVRNKVRGNKKAIRLITEYLDQYEFDEEVKPIVLNAAVQKDNEEVMEGIKSYLKEKNIEYITSDVGCVVGTHSGKNACGIFFLSK